MDNHGFIIAPLVVSPVTVHDSVLFPGSLHNLVDIADIVGFRFHGSYVTLDAGFDARCNRELIRWYGAIPVIKPNPRREKDVDKLNRRYAEFNREVYKERYKIERTFAWQDTYRKLVIRYEKLECTHTGFKYLAYSMINLRVFMQGNRENLV